MKVLSLTLTILVISLPSSFTYVPITPSGWPAKQSLITILNGGHTTGSSAISRRCHDKYIPLIHNSIQQGQRNASECSRRAEQLKADEIESTQIVRESLNEKVKYATSSLGSCTHKYDALEYFKCLELYSPMIQKALRKMLTTSSLLKESLRARFVIIETEEKCCRDNASKESERFTERLLNQLEKCLIDNMEQANAIESEGITDTTENLQSTRMPQITKNLKNIEDSDISYKTKQIETNENLEYTEVSGYTETSYNTKQSESMEDVDNIDSTQTADYIENIKASGYTRLADVSEEFENMENGKNSKR